MPVFKCPNCDYMSNKFIHKCPKCGYERLLKKEILLKDGSAKNNRELRRKKRLDGDKFRGGRNKSFVGVGRKQHPRRGNR